MITNLFSTGIIADRYVLQQSLKSWLHASWTKPPLITIHSKTDSYFHFIKAQFTVGPISYFQMLNRRLLHPGHYIYIYAVSFNGMHYIRLPYSLGLKKKKNSCETGNNLGINIKSVRSLHGKQRSPYWNCGIPLSTLLRSWGTYQLSHAPPCAHTYPHIHAPSFLGNIKTKTIRIQTY